MLINMRRSQLRVNSTRDSDFTLRETSTSFQLSQMVDTLIFQTIETWQSRLRMEEEPKSGTSINNLGLSDPDTTTNLGTLRALVELMTCKSGALTDNGSNYSSMRTTSSLTGETIKLSMFKMVKMLKDKKFVSGPITEAEHNNGELFILTQQKKTGLRDSIKNLDFISIDHST
jgi:hypothetical protein